VQTLPLPLNSASSNQWGSGTITSVLIAQRSSSAGRPVQEALLLSLILVRWPCPYPEQRGGKYEIVFHVGVVELKTVELCERGKTRVAPRGFAEADPELIERELCHGRFATSQVVVAKEHR
jgi:hypothetical protein